MSVYFGQFMASLAINRSWQAIIVLLQVNLVSYLYLDDNAGQEDSEDEDREIVVPEKD